jgi:DNA-binding response OmpR family regulator
MNNFVSGRVSPKSRVLIADADATAREACREPFAGAECDVVEAADGRDALVLALTKAPTLVVTELDLPLLNGFDLCEILRRDRVTAKVPIIGVSHRTSAVDIGRAKRVGANAVLTKPVSGEDLLLEARELLNRSNELLAESRAVQERSNEALRESAALLVRSENLRRPMKSHVHERVTTTTPPTVPPSLRCPTCDRPLIYERSNLGGVNAGFPEQWDYFTCPACGSFQYRHRSRKIRRVG